MKQGYISNSALYIKQRPSSLVENPILRPRSPLCLSLRLRPLSVFLSKIPFHGAATSSSSFFVLKRSSKSLFSRKKEGALCVLLRTSANSFVLEMDLKIIMGIRYSQKLTLFLAVLLLC
jgi:hypothetical protein